jgi:hypothetical protein
MDGKREFMAGMDSEVALFHRDARVAKFSRQGPAVCGAASQTT